MDAWGALCCEGQDLIWDWGEKYFCFVQPTYRFAAAGKLQFSASATRGQQGISQSLKVGNF